MSPIRPFCQYTATFFLNHCIIQSLVNGHFCLCVILFYFISLLFACSYRVSPSVEASGRLKKARNNGSGRNPFHGS